ncbi:hypothetical protein [Streptomyces mirabilis]
MRTDRRRRLFLPVERVPTALRTISPCEKEIHALMEDVVDHAPTA